MDKQIKERPTPQAHRQKTPHGQTDQGKANAAGKQTHAPPRQTNQAKAPQQKTQPETARWGNQKQKPLPLLLPQPPTQTQTPGNKKSHYMNQTLTYWSFLKNRPTIQPNTHREPENPATTSDSKKKTGDKPCLRPKGSNRMPAPVTTRTVPRAKQVSSPAPRCKRKKLPESESP